MAKKANVGDLFKIARLIDDLDMKNDLISIYESEGNIQEKGFEILFSILNKAIKEETEKKIYDILSSPFEMDPVDVKNLDLDIFVEMCEQCFTLEKVINFINRVSN